MGTVAATRARRKFNERATGFLTILPGDRVALASLLGRVDDDVDRVYLVGERPGEGGAHGLYGWAGVLPDGWHEHPRGHYLESEHPVLRVVRPDGRPLELLRASAWYGEGDYSAGDAAGAWELLGDALRRTFDAGALALSSPAATGRELFLRSIPRGAEWPVLSAEHQELIRATTGQGRIELFPRAGELEQLVGYDGRLMYTALCRELPAGEPEHRRVTDFLGYTRARYHVTAHVPRDWHERCQCGAPGHAGLGLLAYRDPDVVRAGWEYPSEPGRSFTGWHDGAELLVALAHGWSFTWDTALVFDRAPGAGPLDGWSRRLLQARELLLLATPRNDGPERRAHVLAGVAVRAIALHAIGAFHGGARKVTRSCPLDQPEHVPADALYPRAEGERIVWTEETPPAWPELVHPEWSAAIWARARTRLLDGPSGRTTRAGALHVPAEQLVAFRTDALYMSDDPEWPDDGAPGRLRRTYRSGGPVRAPRSSAELLELTRGL